MRFRKPSLLSHNRSKLLQANRWRARINSVSFNILQHYRVCTYHSVIANSDISKQSRICIDSDVVTDGNGVNWTISALLTKGNTLMNGNVLSFLLITGNLPKSCSIKVRPILSVDGCLTHNLADFKSSFISEDRNLKYKSAQKKSCLCL